VRFGITNGGNAETAAAPSPVVNAGDVTVSQAGDAYGILVSDPGSQVTNTADGYYNVTSLGGIAYGWRLERIPTALNDGTITVSGHDAAYGLYVRDFSGGASITNNGVVSVSASAGPTVGVALGGHAGDAPAYLINSGVISATVAVMAGNWDGAGYAPLVIANSGLLNGDVQIGSERAPMTAAVSYGALLTNTGVINGDIHLTDGWVDVDLRGGFLSGALVIDGDAGDQIRSHIQTGADPVRISIHGQAGDDIALVVESQAGGQTVVQFDVASTVADWRQNRDGSWTVHAGVDGTLTLTAVGTLSFTDHDVALAAGPPAATVATDFNADGKSDVLWRNDSGEIYAWNSQSGQGAFLGQSLGNPGLGWHLQDVADYSGDGKADILWRNNAGDFYVYKSDAGAEVSFTGQSVSYVDPVWAVVPQAGDFNGDGRADILFRNTATGEVYVWNSQTGSPAVNFLGQSLGTVGTDWSIKGVGDFNGDGRADVLWRSDAGDVYVWLDSPTGAPAMTGQTVSSVGNDWAIMGLGDFNGDGRDDILWRHAGDGELYVWNSQLGSSAVNFLGQSVGVVGLDWSVASIGDYDGDGRADVLFRNADGRVYLWNSTDTGPVGFAGQGLGSTSADWHILSDFHGM
jgi:hypothetical protein